MVGETLGPFSSFAEVTVAALRNHVMLGRNFMCHRRAKGNLQGSRLNIRSRPPEIRHVTGLEIAPVPSLLPFTLEFGGHPFVTM